MSVRDRPRFVQNLLAVGLGIVAGFGTALAYHAVQSRSGDAAHANQIAGSSLRAKDPGEVGGKPRGAQSEVTPGWKVATELSRRGVAVTRIEVFRDGRLNADLSGFLELRSDQLDALNNLFNRVREAVARENARHAELEVVDGSPTIRVRAGSATQSRLGFDEFESSVAAVIGSEKAAALADVDEFRSQVVREFRGLNEMDQVYLLAPRTVGGKVSSVVESGYLAQVDTMEIRDGLNGGQPRRVSYVSTSVPIPLDPVVAEEIQLIYAALTADASAASGQEKDPRL